MPSAPLAEPLEVTGPIQLVLWIASSARDTDFTAAVTDFLDLHWRGLHWPAFNLADVFIVLAAGAWILMSFRPSVATSGNPS